MHVPHVQYWKRYGHIPVMIVLQIVFIVLFGVFVVYAPDTAQHSRHRSLNTNQAAKDEMTGYPMFQDVHVMIFVGFGFLMTFLKKYGLSAVSLNMLCAVISLQWATLVIGFFHMHKDYVKEVVTMPNGTTQEIKENWSHPVIYLDLTHSMLYSDFASAAVLISFGVVIGVTSPLQLIIMTLIEIVLFTVNEVIGRNMLNAADAGDSIFVHLFGAYFGLAVSRMLYSEAMVGNKKQGSGHTSDLFSMIGTVFLWMFWPSFNGAAAAVGEPQHRAVLNTYFSLCASVVASFAVSSLLNEHNKFVMEHIQNATLAGGVAVGAVADLYVQPFGALIIGAVAGTISVIGYEFFTPWLEKKLKMHDTCGVHNLHGVPGAIGTILSIIFAAIATEDVYTREGLSTIYPATDPSNENPITVGQQALNQFLAGVVTMAIALVGGACTGLILRWVGKLQATDGPSSLANSTIAKLAIAVGNVILDTHSKANERHDAFPKDCMFDDNLFFVVHSDEQDLVETNNCNNGQATAKKPSAAAMAMRKNASLRQVTPDNAHILTTYA